MYFYFNWLLVILSPPHRSDWEQMMNALLFDPTAPLVDCSLCMRTFRCFSRAESTTYSRFRFTLWEGGVSTRSRTEAKALNRSVSGGLAGLQPPSTPPHSVTVS